jgi:hypothetical protein
MLRGDAGGRRERQVAVGQVTGSSRGESQRGSPCHLRNQRPGFGRGGKATGAGATASRERRNEPNHASDHDSAYHDRPRHGHRSSHGLLSRDLGRAPAIREPRLGSSHVLTSGVDGFVVVVLVLFVHGRHRGEGSGGELGFGCLRGSIRSQAARATSTLVTTRPTEIPSEIRSGRGEGATPGVA